MRYIWIVIILMWSPGLWAEMSMVSGKVLSIPHHKSAYVSLAGKASRVSLGDPEVLDIVMLKSNELFLIGKKLGTTNLMVWDRRGRLIDSIDIEVIHDLNSLKSKLYEFLPDEEIKVHSAKDRLILSGQISSQARMMQALRIAETYAAAQSVEQSAAGGVKALKASSEKKDDNPVVNLMTIGGAQQVMLEVSVAEVQRSLVRRFDSNFHFFETNGKFAWGGTAAGGIIDDITGGIGPIFNSPSIDETGLLSTFIDGDTLFTLALDIAKENGVAKVLAEPNLTALSGSKARFLAGGEFPIPVPDDDGITIEYKEYGVILSFTPTVLSDKQINLDLSVDVSEIASTSTFTYNLSGTDTVFYIPPITRRSASSTVELADGQTIGIAGLLSENVRDSIRKLPGFGDIPILGQLFRSQEYISGETELVILVTPRLAKPIDRSKVTLPTDTFVEPNDLEYYLLGQGASLSRPPGSKPAIRVQRASHIGTRTGGSEGAFGHEM
ncbi:Type II secretion system protein D precursor [Vibrio quintilis]|uniref:Type II secretion system protein D n=2 Tax=Vibrio quintilis TaxID=1117707 RepID=A0A1M7YS80_9VIBR|nr:Type II secretion system protein D precursor [Vibrio quintilis]